MSMVKKRLVALFERRKPDEKWCQSLFACKNVERVFFVVGFFPLNTIRKGSQVENL